MGKKIAISMGLVGVLGLVLWLALGRDPGPTPTQDSVAPVASSAGPADLTAGAVAGSAEVLPLADLAAEIPLASVNLGVGDAGIQGIVSGADGSAAAGATVSLYRTRLSDELATDEGIALWQLFGVGDGGRGAGPGGFFQGIERRPIHQRYRDTLDRVAQVTADESGAYTFRGLQAGSYLVAGQSADSLDTPSRRVSYLAGSVETLNFTLASGAEVRGLVMDPQGAPVALASVTAEGQLLRLERMQDAFLSLYDVFVYVLNPITREAKTDSRGEFTMARLPALEYRFTASAAPWADGTVLKTVSVQDQVEVTLLEAATLVGQVTSDRGPMAGVTVTLAHTFDFGGGGGMERMVERMFAVPVEVATDADGMFRFERLASGRYDVSASAPAHQNGTVRAVGATPGEVTEVSVSLEAGAVIEGTVRDPAGKPIAGAELRARSNSRRGGMEFMTGGRAGRGGGRAESRTDAEGRFRLDDLAAGEYTLEVSHEDWVRQSVPAKTNDRPLDIALEPGFVVKGTVVDELDAPVAGARVSLEKDRGSARRVVTDGQGEFRVAGLAEGTYALVVQARHRLTLRDDIDAAEGDLGIIVLPPAVTLAGVVMDPSGAPLIGARVQAVKKQAGDAPDDANLERGPRGRGVQRVVGGAELTPVRGGGWQGGLGGFAVGRRQARASDWTGQDGSFLVRLPEPDGEWTLTATHAGLKNETIESVRVAGVAVEGLTLRLSFGATLSGRVTSPDGAPVANASLTLRAPSDAWGPPSMARSDVDGSFRFSGLDPGDYALRAQAAGYAGAVLPGVALAAEQATTVDVRLESERVIRGTVVSEAGGPVGGAMVIARAAVERPRPAMSDGAGFFEITGLGPGTVELQVRHDGYQVWRQSEVSTEVGEIRIVLEPSYSLTGIVLDAETGEPVAGANLTARKADQPAATEFDGPDVPNRRGRGDRGRSADDGTFSIDELAKGVWNLTVEASGFVPSQIDGLVVPGGSVEILLDAGGRIRGKVTERDGRPIAGVQVRVTSSVSDDSVTPAAANERGAARIRVRPVGRGTTGDDGWFEVSGITTGVFKVVYEHTEFVRAERDGILIAPGEKTPELEQVLERGAEVSGRARLASGATGVLVLQGGEPSVVRYHDLTEGLDYRFSGLAPGVYTLQYRTSMRRGETLSEVQFTVEGRGSQRVDVPAPAS